MKKKDKTRKTSALFLLIVILHSLVISNLSLVIASEYTLAPGDQLEVKIIGQKDFDAKQAIAPDGTVSLPMVGRIRVEGLNLKQLDQSLTKEFSKYMQKPQPVVYLTPRPTYVIQHNIKTNTWDVKEAKSLPEAKAFAGRDYGSEIKNGDVISVEIGQKPDWWESNWYKVITGTAVLVGIYSTVKK